MTPDRFVALSQAYGGRVERWPVNDQAGAVKLCQDRPVWTAKILSDAAQLDAILDAYALTAPSVNLRQRIYAEASRPARTIPLGLRRWGFGLAAASLAGVICGAALMSLAAPDLTGDGVVVSALGDQTLYGDVASSNTKEAL